MTGGRGAGGVDLFFVLSGFLITGILFDTRDDSFRARNFYVRRTLRIFPLFYGIMLLLVLTYPLVHWRLTWGWLMWPAYIGNFAGYIHPSSPDSPLRALADFQPSGILFGHPVKLFLGHFWSLCVEEQFYLVWPWVVFWIRDRRKLLWICAATLPICLAMRLAGEQLLPKWMLDRDILYCATPFRMDALLLGGLLALSMRGSNARSILRGARILFPIVGAGFMLCFAFIPSTRIWHRGYVEPLWRNTWGLTLVDLLSALLILVALQPNSIVYRILKLRPLRWLGRISYGAYVLHNIFHPVIRHWVDRHLPTHPTRATAIMSLVVTIILAWLSFRFFESPFLELKERWTHQPERKLLPWTASPR